MFVLNNNELVVNICPQRLIFFFFTLIKCRRLIQLKKNSLEIKIQPRTRQAIGNKLMINKRNKRLT